MPGKTDTNDAATLSNIANHYQEQGKYDEAEPFYRRALAIREKELGPDHPDIASSLNNLTLVYCSQGNRISLTESAGDQREGAGTRSSRHGSKPQQSGITLRLAGKV
jgi:tetratricopeptide (TPR) repeat protein